MTSLAFVVHGFPAAQGSKRHVGRGIMIESSKALKPWRQDVVGAALLAIGDPDVFEPFAGPVHLWVSFRFIRPKHHFRTGAHKHQLRPNAPRLVVRTPDLDKLLRSTCDALTIAGAWRDDAQVAMVTADKVYHDHPGAAIEIRSVLA